MILESLTDWRENLLEYLENLGVLSQKPKLLDYRSSVHLLIEGYSHPRQNIKVGLLTVPHSRKGAKVKNARATCLRRCIFLRGKYKHWIGCISFTNWWLVGRASFALSIMDDRRTAVNWGQSLYSQMSLESVGCRTSGNGTQVWGHWVYRCWFSHLSHNYGIMSRKHLSESRKRLWGCLFNGLFERIRTKGWPVYVWMCGIYRYIQCQGWHQRTYPTSIKIVKPIICWYLVGITRWENLRIQFIFG